MAEDKTPAPEKDQGEIESKETEAVTLESLQAEMEKLGNEVKTWKGRYEKTEKEKTALARDKEKLEKEKLSAEELAEAERKKDQEVLIAEIKALKFTALNIPDDSDFSGLLDGQTGQEVKERAEMLAGFKAHVLKEANTEIEELKQEIEKLKGNMKNPGSGKASDVSEKGILQEQYNEAMKAGDVTKAIAIKDKIAKLK